jgi:hypothetical protein
VRRLSASRRAPVRVGKTRASGSPPIGDRLVGGEDVAEVGLDLDLAQAGGRLGAADEDARACQIDVAPEHVTQLDGAWATEDEGADDRLALGEFVVGIAVELGRRLQQRLDLRGAVDVDGGRAALAQAPPLTFGGVLGDAEALVFDGDRERPLQVVDRPVDRPRRKRSQYLAVVVSLRLAPLDRPRAGPGLLHLERAVLVYALDVDLLECPIAEEGDEVPQRPLFVLGRFLGDLTLAGGGQVGGKRAEVRHPIGSALVARPARLLLGGRHPEPAANVGEDVLQLHVGPLVIPVFVLIAERQVLALAVGAEAKRVDAAGLPLSHEYPTFLVDAHN